MKNKIWKTVFHILYPFFDWVCVFTSCLMAYNIYYHLGIGKQVAYGESDYIIICSLAGLVSLLTLHISGAYNRESSVLNVAEIRSVIKGITATFLLYLLLTFFLRATHSRYMVVMAFLFSMISLVVIRTFFYHLHPFLSERYAASKRVLIYGAGEIGQALFRTIMDSPRLNIQPIGFLEDDPEKKDFAVNRSGFDTRPSIKVLGNFNDMERLAQKHRIDAIFVAISGINNETLETISIRAKSLGLDVCFIPNLYKSFVHKLQVVQIGPFPMIEEISTNLKQHNFIKRISDFTLSLFLIFLLSPVWILVALFIKLDTKGPVLFKQNRVGRGGNLFKMYKFRSMYTDTPVYAVNPTTRNDHRVTTVGRFIRRTSFDELPQLLNVLKGEMSFVGPRPEMPFIVEKYTDFHRERLRVLPGITGLWQLSGDRSEPIHVNMDYDLYYIRNQSFSLDLAILIETLIFSFRGI